MSFGAAPKHSDTGAADAVTGDEATRERRKYTLTVDLWANDDTGVAGASVAVKSCEATFETATMRRPRRDPAWSRAQPIHRESCGRERDDRGSPILCLWARGAGATNRNALLDDGTADSCTVLPGR